MAMMPELECERVRAVFAQAPVALAATLVNASLAAGLIILERGDWRALSWLLATLGIIVLRFVTWRRYRASASQDAVDWRWALLGGSLASGLAWGGGAAWLMPETETYRLFWIFLVGGMCAGAAALHYPHRPTVLAFILPAGLPLVLRSMIEGSSQGVVEALLLLAFIAVLAVSARGFGLQFDAMIRLRIDLAVLRTRLAAEIAEHRATEANLFHAQKMEAVGHLTGGIAHDFNNLLMAVLGSLKLLRKRLPVEDAKARQLIDNALAGAERGAGLTRRLLAFGRRTPSQPERVELPRLVRGMADLLHNSLSAAIQLQLRLPAELPPVRVDPNQLELALLNLVVNARDAMPGGGTITITGRVAEPEADTLPPGAYVVLSVADTGEGMDDATLARAAEPFFTTKPAGKGTGLGLPMVQGLALGSGGQFLLRSVPGIGTEAELWLPRAPAEAAAEAPPSPAPAAPPSPTVRRTVLLVDDDPLVLASTRAMLEDLGHAVLEASSGPEALELLRAGRAADLVITDYAMPGMTGVQLAATIRQHWPGLPVLLATGYAEVPGEGEGALPRLEKPFDAEALARATSNPRLDQSEPRSGGIT
ncbi:response regulator [Belnapia moabensis]|uniref:response regulator n=1 Tax=Belnapia moabensis TaxID=365533 RepID=UPI0006947893|nr:response regulator [Belnapia moabensis]